MWETFRAHEALSLDDLPGHGKCCRSFCHVVGGSANVGEGVAEDIQLMFVRKIDIDRLVRCTACESRRIVDKAIRLNGGFRAIAENDELTGVGRRGIKMQLNRVRHLRLASQDDGPRKASRERTGGEHKKNERKNGFMNGFTQHARRGTGRNLQYAVFTGSFQRAYLVF
jgi:hypothetical protein